MRTKSDVSRSYARAFIVRARMRKFHTDLGNRPGWRLTSDLFMRRFELALGFFLDAPTPERLARVVAFEGELAQFAVRITAPPWQRDLGRPPRG
jgi:hypothetical protein